MREAFPREEAQGTSRFESSDTRSAASGDGSDSCVDREFFRQPQQVCSVKQGVMFRLAWAVHDCVLLISVLPRPFENDPPPRHRRERQDLRRAHWLRLYEVF